MSDDEEMGLIGPQPKPVFLVWSIGSYKLGDCNSGIFECKSKRDALSKAKGLQAGNKRGTYTIVIGTKIKSRRWNRSKTND